MEVFRVSIKEDIIKIIQDLPENVTIEDIMHKLYVRAKIEDGLKELDAGKGIPHEEAMGKISKWLD
jgi:predicted transcriptional regulator